MTALPLNQTSLIAVVIPAYNIAQYITECLDSLLAQTYPNWIAYVVNDGSSDGTAQILDHYAKMDARFKVFHKENGGLSSARNFALDRIEESSEQFTAVTFLDGDDWLDPNAYAEWMAAYVTENADIVFCGFKRAYPDSIEEWEFSRQRGKVSRDVFFEAVFSYGNWLYKNGAWGVVWNKLYRYELIKDIRFIEDRNYVEDELFCVYAGLKASTFYFIDKSFIYYRQRSNSISHSADIHFMLNRARMRILSILDECSVPEKESIIESVKYGILITLTHIYTNKIIPDKTDYFIADAAETVLPVAKGFLKHEKITLSQYEYIKGLSQLRKYDVFLSVLVPVYNVEKYLRRSIDSIINQTLQNIEIICVNDGSTDGSLQILQEYAGKDERIRVINKEKNEGIMLARKSAVLQAKGKYIVFIDPDDFLNTPESLQTMVGLIEQEQVDILQFSVEALEPDGKRANWDWHKVYEAKINCTKDIIGAFCDNKYSFNLWNKIYRSECVIEALKVTWNIHMNIAEDVYIYFLIAFHASSFSGIKTSPLYTYRASVGVSTEQEIDLHRYAMFCQENLLIGWFESFLLKKGVSEKEFSFYKEKLKRLSQRFLEQCYGLWQKFNDNDKDAAWTIFCKYYPFGDIFRFMQEKLLVAEREKTVFAEQCRQFSIGRYLRTKILSKLTFGSMRRNLKEQYKKQKKLYRAIKKGQI